MLNCSTLWLQIWSGTGSPNNNLTSPNLQCATQRAPLGTKNKLCDPSFLDALASLRLYPRQSVSKGRVTFPNRMNFRKSSKRLLTPPPHFRKVTLRFSRQNCDKSNRVKTYPKRPFCITFMLKKPYLKLQILQYNFLDRK